jgi:hypothetical protein
MMVAMEGAVAGEGVAVSGCVIASFATAENDVESAKTSVDNLREILGME